MSWNIGAFCAKLFVGEKGIVNSVSDIADKWMPSKTTIHNQNLEDQTAGDSSQESARGMTFKSHQSYFDIMVDCFNRLPRPGFALWAFGVLVGWWEPPEYLLIHDAETGFTILHPLMGNIIWTIITFYFGARVIFKDIPNLVKWARKAVKRD